MSALSWGAIEPHLPILLIVLPLFGGLLTTFLRNGTLAWAVTTIVTFSLPVIAGALLYDVASTGRTIIYEIGGWPTPFGIAYKVDSLSAFVLFVIAVIGAVILPYARHSVRLEIPQAARSWYYTMYLLCLCGLLGIVITNDAFNAFVFLEISSLATYVLIALGRHRRALLAAYQYLIMGTIGATLYVIGVGLLLVVTGTLNFDDMAARLPQAIAEPGQRNAVFTALGFIVVGLGLKLALFPMHMWLPNAYAYAPSIATAFLAGTATKAAIYLLMRLGFGVFGGVFAGENLPIAEVLIILSVAAMFLASISAVFEENAKRMLAYSSIAQVGYITLGIAIANQAGLTGALAHIANHAVMKTAMFLSLGAVFYRVGSVVYGDIAGIGRRMPLTMTAFFIGGLGLMGIPGTAGFISKWYLAVGAIDAQLYSMVFLIVASSLISVVYIGRITEIVWFREPVGAAATATDPPLSMLIPLWALALLTIYMGFDTRFSVDVADSAAELLRGGLR